MRFFLFVHIFQNVENFCILGKHMDPEDLRIIYGNIKSLSTSNGFQQNARPFFFQEVIDMGNEAVRREEYRALGTVTEFTFSTQVSSIYFHHNFH